MCKQCGGSGFLYSGTGHRKLGYSFAELMVCDGVCPNCDNAAKRKEPMTQARFDAYCVERDAKHDAIIADVSARWEASKTEVNERRASAGKGPLIPSWCTCWPNHESGMCEHCRELRRWRDE